MRDPIAELVEDLTAHGAPSLAWTLRWGEGGVDPVATAWARSCSPAHMAALLRVSGHPSHLAAAKLATAPVLFASSDIDRARSEAIRRLVPTPPVFSDVLARP